MTEEQDRESQATFLTEDVVINILLRLPIASCISLFRCVCRSWRNLLSDPEFIRKILFFRTTAEQQSLRILIAGDVIRVLQTHSSSFNLWPVPAAAAQPPRVRQTHYSLHSYDALCPVSAAAAVPCKMRNYRPGNRLAIVGCCDGIFCISTYPGSSVSDISMWNPTTSETRLLPLSSCPRAPSFLMCCEEIGFGFDPLTRDYKVVRTLVFERIDEEDDNGADDDGLVKFGCPSRVAYTEVYSLRNDSWKRLLTANDDIIINAYPLNYIHQQHRDTFNLISVKDFLELQALGSRGLEEKDAICKQQM
ncbi:unnamed protein product [Linum tenue]|uniref:F-box domain-containing protein n=1 Tax=Linum tenue TaxID=586396 RepID=A0AAV0NNC3_9ROSI|nr:unnamed protein product [Linum tenue]